MGEGDEFDLDACLTMEGGCRVGLASRTSLPCPLHSRKASRGRKRTMEGERKEEAGTLVFSYSLAALANRVGEAYH